MYARADTEIVNLDTGETISVLPRGSKFSVSSTTEWFGHKYAISQYSTDRSEGRGVRIDDLDLKPVGDPVVPAPSQPDIESRVSWLEKAVNKLLGK